MKEYSNVEINRLIQCGKVVTEPPRRQMRHDRGCLRNDFKLRSEQFDGEFVAFLRVNERFPENFSIGLEYVPKGEKGNIILMRCNGPHGPYWDEQQGMVSSPHKSFHIHKAKSENIESGFRPERGGTATTEYACFEEALRFFLREIHVQSPEEYFPGINQMIFDFMNSEES